MIKYIMLPKKSPIYSNTKIKVRNHHQSSMTNDQAFLLKSADESHQLTSFTLHVALAVGTFHIAAAGTQSAYSYNICAGENSRKGIGNYEM